MRALRLFHTNSPFAEKQRLPHSQRFAGSGDPPQLCAVLSPGICCLSLARPHQEELYEDCYGRQTCLALLDCPAVFQA